MATTGEEQLPRKDLPRLVYVVALFGIAIGSFVGAILLTGHPIASQIPVFALAPPYGAIHNWFFSLLGFGMSAFFFCVRWYATNKLSISFFGVSLVAAIGLIPLLFGLWGFVFLVPLLTILALREQKKSSNQSLKADPH